MRKELAALGLALVLGTLLKSDTRLDQYEHDYMKHKANIDLQLWPNLSSHERAHHAAVGCLLWGNGWEGACAIVDFNAKPTVVTIGHVVRVISPEGSDSKISMYIPGSADHYQLNAGLFSRFGDGDDPIVIYDIKKDSNTEHSLVGLKEAGSLEPLQVKSQKDLGALTTPDASFLTLSSDRQPQRFSIRDVNSDGEFVLSADMQSAVCIGDSGAAFYGKSNDGSYYLLGVLEDIARGKNMRADSGLKLKCGPWAMVNPTF